MKTKFVKIKLFFVSLALIMTSCVTVFASSPEEQHSHIDHEGSENCIYSCEHPINNYSYVSGVDVWSEEDAEDFVSECQEVSSNAEMAELISKYYEIPVSETDVEELLKLAKKVQNKTSNREFVKRFNEVSSDDEMVDFLAEFTGISADKIDLDEIKRGISQHTARTAAANCTHYNITGSCQGDHYNQDGCTVLCIRFQVCYYCGDEATTAIPETVHSWSEGWCGRTCTVCGTIEMFHEPGGCWYCS